MAKSPCPISKTQFLEKAEAVKVTIVDKLVPVATADKLRPSFVRSLSNQLSLGITRIVMADETADNVPEWERVHREHRGELPRRPDSVGE